MKAYQKVLTGLVASLTLILVSCPSPTGGISVDSNRYESSASVEFDASQGLFVFVDEDGSQIPLVTETGEGPIEIIDFSVLNDEGSTARSSGNTDRVRCIVVGRRSDGRSGVWVVYRHHGMVVVPNEDGVTDSSLMELVETEDTPWIGEGWIYDAKAVSGNIIIGQLSRPDGWKYIDGDVPDPAIGVWWVVRETEERVFVTRARPMLMMTEPESSVARYGRPGPIRNWLEMIIEWLQAFVLNQAWNYMSDVNSFVDPGVITGGIPEGYYVVSGTDKYGDAAWAWLTAGSMEDIVDAPVVDPPVENTAPFNLTTARPTDVFFVTNGQTSQLLVDGSLTDPSEDILDIDGNTGVSFLYYDPMDGALPSGWSLDPDTGVIGIPNLSIVDLGGSTATLFFQTYDGEEFSEPLEVTFSFTYPSGG